MPHYRLVADHGNPTEEFEAESDSAAEVWARERSHSTATSKATGFRLETVGDAGWSVVAAWLPRWVRDHPGGLGSLVHPSSPPEP